MEWWLVKHRDNFTFFTFTFRGKTLIFINFTEWNRKTNVSHVFLKLYKPY
jgi:hypothetical protein